MDVSILEEAFFSLGSGPPQVHDKSGQRHIAGAPDETNAHSQTTRERS
jgi:hypothetical protein